MCLSGTRQFIETALNSNACFSVIEVWRTRRTYSSKVFIMQILYGPNGGPGMRDHYAGCHEIDNAVHRLLVFERTVLL